MLITHNVGDGGIFKNATGMSLSGYVEYLESHEF